MCIRDSPWSRQPRPLAPRRLQQHLQHTRGRDTAESGNGGVAQLPGSPPLKRVKLSPARFARRTARPHWGAHPS
eukprot:7372440-Prymnesium_polylepis.1